MARTLTVLIALVFLAQPAIAAAPKSPKGPWSGAKGATGDRLGFKLAGSFDRDGRKTGLYLTDLYVGTSIVCERKDEPGTSEQTNDTVSFPGSDRRPLTYNAKSGFYELIFNKATAVRGHTGSAPFGNANYGQGKLTFAMVLGKGGKTGLAQVKFTAEGGAPPMGDLVGTETRGPCESRPFKVSITKGRYAP